MQGENAIFARGTYEIELTPRNRLENDFLKALSKIFISIFQSQ